MTEGAVAAVRAYETGCGHYKEGDFDLAVAHLVTIDKSSSYYRVACIVAIQACARRRALGFQVDQFVAGFRRTTPKTAHELSAMYLLGRLYESEGFDDEALEALEQVVRVDPTHQDAATRLANLKHAQSGAQLADIARDDLAFWRDARPQSSAPPIDTSGFQRRARPDGAADVASDRRPALDPRAAREETVGALGSQPTVATSGVAPGAMIGERYRVEGELGRGGMGVVYRAHDQQLDEAVAIKTVDHNVDNPELLARLKQEVAVSRKVGHPNVVRVYDIGVHGGALFITMELLSGQELKKLVGQLTLGQALDYICQLADGLAAVHRLGVVHRDVKTANVFVTDDGVVKLMDFGLAKLRTGDGDDGMTVSGFVAGTPGYMAPEQVMSFRTVTPAADLYALGAVSYEVFTGKRPFRSKDASKLIRMQLVEGPKSMLTLQPRLPARLDGLVLSLLSPEPEHRPQRAEDVRAELDAIRRDIGA